MAMSHSSSISSACNIHTEILAKQEEMAATDDPTLKMQLGLEIAQLTNMESQEVSTLSKVSKTEKDTHDSAMKSSG